MKRITLIAATGLLAGMTLLSSGCMSYNSARDIPVERIPWQDGEKLTYKSQQDPDVRRIFSFRQEGEVWVIDNELIAPDGTVMAHTELSSADLTVQRSSLGFTSSADASMDWMMQGDYAALEPTMSSTQNGQTSTEEITELPEHLYDVETLGMVVRTFPLTEDFEGPINIVSLYSSGIGGAYVYGNGTQSINGVPCYHLFISTERDVEITHESVFTQLWISMDDNWTLMQFTSGQSLFVLER